MPIYWLVYRHNNSISVVIETGASIIHARMCAALAGLDEGEFTEGHELDRKWKVAKEMVGRRLSQEEAKSVGEVRLKWLKPHGADGFSLPNSHWGRSLRRLALPRGASAA